MKNLRIKMNEKQKIWLEIAKKTAESAINSIGTALDEGVETDHKDNLYYIKIEIQHILNYLNSIEQDKD
jgi:hypothetical protein